MNIARYFDLITTSYSCGIQKPDPRIFQLSFSLLEHEYKDHRSLVLHVGDNKFSDYDGATNAGISALLLTREHSQTDNNYSISSLLQLTEKIHSLN
jgi:FMN phosphatase YigB (HAD superfamily)